MKKNINIKILSTICILAILLVSNTFGVSAVGLEDSNSSYEFVGNSTEEFKGELYVVDDESQNAYVVEKDITWEEDGFECGLQEGDVIGVRETNSDVNGKISYSVHGVGKTINANDFSSTKRLALSSNSSTGSSGDITATHIGYRKTNGSKNTQYIHAETLASIQYMQNGCKKVENIDNYSVAQYEWFFAVYASSGKKWNRGKYHPGGTMWSYADSDTLNLSIARDYCARTYWGTEE